MTALRIIVALLAGVTASSGQGFKVTTELVTIPVTVTDRSGATMVRRLEVADFRVPGQYLLGFTSTRLFDGKYRRLKVEARNASLRVRHRGGYLALPSVP